MNRRGFLKLLGGAAAASATAYFLPPIGGWKSDVIIDPHKGLVPVRMPIEINLGGTVGYYQPDGGSFFRGQAPTYAEQYRLVSLGENNDRIVSRQEYDRVLRGFLTHCEPGMRSDLIEQALKQSRTRDRVMRWSAV